MKKKFIFVAAIVLFSVMDFSMTRPHYGQASIYNYSKANVGKILNFFKDFNFFKSSSLALHMLRLFKKIPSIYLKSVMVISHIT